MVEAAIPNAQVAVKDLTGTRDHYKIIVITDAFAGKSRIQRHMMINQALAEPLKGPIHALSIEAFTNEQWINRPQSEELSDIKF